MDKPKPTQLNKFKQTARELETDDDEDRFEERLASIVKRGMDQKPPVGPPKGVFGKHKPLESRISKR